MKYCDICHFVGRDPFIYKQSEYSYYNHKDFISTHCIICNNINYGAHCFNNSQELECNSCHRYLKRYNNEDNIEIKSPEEDVIIIENFLVLRNLFEQKTTIVNNFIINDLYSPISPSIDIDNVLNYNDDLSFIKKIKTILTFH